MKKSVSIIIPLYNTEKYIAEALDAAYAQTWKDVEVIVVNDGSTDGSANIVRWQYPRAKLIETTNNGLSRARNIGTEHASGEFIQYLDADDTIAPHKLECQVHLLEEKNADIAYCDWAKLLMNGDGTYTFSEVFRRKIVDPDIDLFTAASWNPIHGYLFRRSIIEKLDGWDERLSIIQDNRFIHDCAIQGARFVHCEDVLAYYRIHSNETLSRHNPTAFIRDCFRNAVLTEDLWKLHGGISEERCRALLKVYGYVTRASYENDIATFESAYQAIQNLDPNYTPEYPAHLAIVSRILGYRHAELIALWYRRAKKSIRAGA